MVPSRASWTAAAAAGCVAWSSAPCGRVSSCPVTYTARTELPPWIPPPMPTEHRRSESRSRQEQEQEQEQEQLEGVEEERTAGNGGSGDGSASLLVNAANCKNGYSIGWDAAGTSKYQE